MKVIGNRLEETSTLLPTGGILGAMLPFLGLLGFIAAVADFGMPGLEKAVVAIGMFAAGVLMARSLPVWREARPGEIERLQLLREKSPAAPWIRMLRVFGWVRTVIIFLGLCVVLAFVGKLF